MDDDGAFAKCCGVPSRSASPASLPENEAVTVGIFKQLMEGYILPVNKSLEEINQSLKTLSDKFVDLEKRVLKLEKHDNAVTNLSQKIGVLENKVNNVSVSDISTNNELLFSEIKDRCERSKNIIIYNVKDENKEIVDWEQIAELFSSLKLNVTTVSMVRLGTFESGKSRPLKVSLSTEKDALLILRCRIELTSKGISVSNDMTKVQQKFLKDKREELHDRIENGEKDLTIKFIKNVPTIVTKPSKN